jgi:hypothetical protein
MKPALSRRRRLTFVATFLTLAASASGCSALGEFSGPKPVKVQGPSGGTVSETVPGAVETVKDLMLVVEDASSSDAGNMSGNQLVFTNEILPEAVRRHAKLIIDRVGSEGLTGATTVGVVDFGNLAGEDPTSAADDAVALEQKAIDAFGSPPSAPPSSNSDPLGYLYAAMELREEPEYSRSRTLVVYLGDGVESTSNCDMGLAPSGPATGSFIAGCEAGHPLRLAGVEVWMIGLGRDPNTSTATALQQKTIWTSIISQAGGSLTRADPGTAW